MWGTFNFTMQNWVQCTQWGWFIRCNDNIDTRVSCFQSICFMNLSEQRHLQDKTNIIIFVNFQIWTQKLCEAKPKCLMRVKDYRKGGQRPSHLWGAIHMCPLATGTVAIFIHSTLSYLLFWSATHWIVVIMCKLDMCQQVSDLTHRYRDIQGMMAKRFQRKSFIPNVFLGTNKKNAKPRLARY